jgi:glycerophosphoryl diester phosphodiesterase
VRRPVPPFAADIPVVFAHRGYSSRAPENTLAAFRAAREAGVSAVELDVQQCASGELVVFHDFSLSRITGEPGLVTETSYSELAELDAGAWYSSAFAGERIPRLQDVFEVLGGSVYYDIEIKHDSRAATGLEPALRDTIRRYELSGRCMVSSFNPFALFHLRRLAPELPTALIFADAREVPRVFRYGAGRHLAPPAVFKPHHVQLERPRRFLRRALERGYVLPWTVNEPERAARLVEWGAAGVVSDDPEPVLAALR